MIRFDNVTKRYDDGYQALDNINLHIREGELTVLIGPSGCGKTTTMKLINRLIRPTSGTIRIGDKDIAEIDPVRLRRQIGYVIQSVGLFPHMTIAKNVGVVPRLLKWDKARIDRRVEELLHMVGLPPETYANRYPTELSGGQQQRIGVIRALAADPDIVLLDEPFSALDPISREQLQDELVRLQQELKKTIVFVTHDMDEAIKIADTIVLMRDGSIVQSGKPDHILRHPADEFVTSFIGLKRLQRDPATDPLPAVEEVMVDNPAVAVPTRGLAEAMKLMERRKVDSLLVVDAQRKLLGTVSIYGLLERYREEGLTVKDVMVPLRHAVTKGTSLAVALQLMSENGLSNVPVIGEDAQLVGLITRGSVVSLMAEAYSPAETGGEAYARV